MTHNTLFTDVRLDLDMVRVLEVVQEGLNSAEHGRFLEQLRNK